jgi:hypothetical protein
MRGSLTSALQRLIPSAGSCGKSRAVKAVVPVSWCELTCGHWRRSADEGSVGGRGANTGSTDKSS